MAIHYFKSIILYADPVSGSCLSGYGHIGCLYRQMAFQFNVTRNLKYDCSGAISIFNPIAQRTSAVIIQVGNYIHISPTAAFAKPPVSFRTGKRNGLGPQEVCT